MVFPFRLRGFVKCFHLLDLRSCFKLLHSSGVVHREKMDVGLDKQRSGSHGGSESGRSFRSSPRGLDLETVAPEEDESEPETAVSQNGAPLPGSEDLAWNRDAIDPQEEELYTEKPLIPKQRGQGDEASGRARGWNLEEGGRMLPPLEENSGGRGGRVPIVGGVGPEGGGVGRVARGEEVRGERRR
ncbi:hypothetical protein KFL_004130010, partial [Klebsormidium nitens]